MSEFFNPKEDVIDLELTQYGKYLLSKGEMRPHYYAFYDDDILYDGTYGGVTEAQYVSHARIKNETPRTKTQYVFGGIETEIKKINELITSNLADVGSEQVQPTGDKMYALPMSLGTSGPNTNKSPAWNIFFGKAKITSSLAYFSSSAGNTPIMNIPQIEAHHITTTRVAYDVDESSREDDLDEAPLALTNAPPPEMQNQIEAIEQVEDSFFSRTSRTAAENRVSEFQNGFYYYADQDFVFTDVKEENCLNLKENFDIEVYEINNETDSKTGKIKEVLRQLKFYPSYKDVSNLAQEGMLNVIFPEMSPEYVEYYFDIDVDEEIANHVLCQVDFKNRKENIFADSELEFECFPPLVAPFGSGVGEAEEPC